MAVEPVTSQAKLGDYQDKPSRGERAFNIFAYGIIADAAVFLAGLPVAYYSKYGKSGLSRLYQGAVKRLTKAGMSAETAEDVTMTTVLMQPGNAAVPAVLGAEMYKEKLVGVLDPLLGEKRDSAAELKKEPKQTIMSLVKARLVAWGAVFGSFRAAASLLPEKFEAFKHGFAAHFCRFLGKPTHIGERIAANETAAFRVGKIGALDFFATGAAALLLYGGSRVFAEKEQQPANVEPAAKRPKIKDFPKQGCPSCRPRSYVAGMVHSEGFVQAVTEKHPPDISRGARS